MRMRKIDRAMSKHENITDRTCVATSITAKTTQVCNTMTSPERYGLVHLSFVVFMVSVCVAPLSAEISASGYRHQTLKMDEAHLKIHNELTSDVVVYWVSNHCHQCLYQQLGVLPKAPTPGQQSSRDVVVGTQHEMTLMVNSTAEDQVFCSVPFHFGELGNYSLWLKSFSQSSAVNCTIVTDAVPINSYLPLLVAFLIYAGLVLLFAISRTLTRLDFLKRILLGMSGTMEAERLINSELGPSGRGIPPITDTILPPLPSPSKRLQSLDTFRGISLVIMVFVNYGGGRYWFFRHESWNGLTVADLVFPWFVFIMGTSIALSINSQLRAGVTRFSVLKKVLWRSVQLFVIGVVIVNPNYCQGPLSWDNLRIPGVLQRLAWSYLVVACLDLLFARGHLDIITADAWWSPFLDILFYWPAWLCVVLLEVLWLCLTFLLPVPGCPAGYLGPGGIGDMGQYFNCTGGAAAFIDRWLLGESHIYQTPSPRVIYATLMPHDPEGVLGSINSVVLGFLGLQAGKIILHYRDLHNSILSRFLIWGFLLGVISAVLTNCSTNKGIIPVNKNLWSLSYVTTLGCFAFVLLAVVYYAVDVRRWWSGGPFYYAGMNSILIYIGHEVLEDYFPFRWRMANTQSHAEHLAQNLIATSIWVLISYVLFRKKIFWKV